MNELNCPEFEEVLDSVFNIQSDLPERSGSKINKQNCPEFEEVLDSVLPVYTK